jgi:uncharacterized membrane protein
MPEITDKAKPKLRGYSGVSIGRIVSFSDAVFAVAITLLVLNIRLPALTEGQAQANLAGELAAQWPHYFAYMLSFIVIGAFWKNHHQFFDHLARHDETFTWLNIIYLMCVVFIPFPTYVLSEYGDIRVSVILYAATLSACGLMSTLMIWYASSGSRLVKADVKRISMLEGIASNLTFVTVFAVSIGISFLSVSLATYSWIVVFPAEVAVSRYFVARRKASPA